MLFMINTKFINSDST